jgi:hypothetical protein
VAAKFLKTVLQERKGRVMSVLAGYFDVSTYASIQAAQTACEAAGGGVLYFPPRKYPLMSTVIVGATNPAAYVQWRGTGPGSSQIEGLSLSSTQPTMVSSVSGVSNFAISDLGFIGNNFPPGTTSNAPPVIVFNGGAFIKILNCYFTLNQGRTIDFEGVSDGEVSGCNFLTVGYAGNTSYTTEAIVVDENVGSKSEDIRIHHNHFDSCNFGVIRLGPKALGCDVSHNYLTNSNATGIYFSAGRVRIAFNSVSIVKTISGITNCAGIQADQASSFCIVGNNVTKSDGDGIAVINGWANAVIIGNNCSDNNQSADNVGNSGIHLTSTNAATNTGLVLLGNNCFDDQNSPTQQYGIRIDSSESPQPATSSAIMGNATYNNATDNGIYDPSGITSDDSNTIMGNTGDIGTGTPPGVSGWFERIHTTSPMAASSGTQVVLQSSVVARGSMREQCGVKVTAGGSSGLSGGDVYYLGFHPTSSTNIGSFTTPNLGSGATGSWMIVAHIMNYKGNTSNQAITATMFFGTAGSGVVVGAIETTLEADTTLEQVVWLSATPASGHTTTCDYMTVERC